MKSSQKVSWFLAIAAVFLLILMTNLIDRKNFSRIEESVDNIYNERLLAKELLLDISIRFHKKELAYALNDTNYLASKNQKINSEITNSLKMFERARATRSETAILNELNENHSKLIELEAASTLDEKLYSQKCADLFAAINANIVELASEQVLEGEKQQSLARDAVNTVKLFTKMEIYILVFLGIFLQIIVLVIYKPKKS
jgi:hypothetical protein